MDLFCSFLKRNVGSFLLGANILSGTLSPEHLHPMLFLSQICPEVSLHLPKHYVQPLQGGQQVQLMLG
jgi:hypothetical protein